MELRVTTEYDTEADAVYIAFDTPVSGEARQNIMIDDSRLKDGEIVIDLDAHGHLLGIELIGVTTMLSRPRSH